MGNIPILAPQNTPGGQSEYQQVDTTAGTRGALQAFAQGTSSLADTLYKSEELNRVADRQVKEYQIEDAVRGLKDKYNNMKGTQAAGVAKEFDTDFNNLMTDQLDGVDNQRTRIELEGFLYHQKNQLANWAFNHIDQQTTQAIKDADALTFNGAQKDVNSLAIGDLQGIYKIRDGALAKHSELDHSPENIAVTKAIYNDALISQAFNKWYTEDPQAATIAWRTHRNELKSVLSTKAYTAEAQKYEKNMKQVRVANARDAALVSAGGDYSKAAEIVLGDSFRQKYNITVADQSALYHLLTSVNRNRIEQLQYKRQEDDRASLNQIITSLHKEDGSTDVQGALKVADSLYRHKLLGPSTYVAIRNNILQANWEVNPKRYGNIAIEAASGRLDEVGVLKEFLKGGLGKNVGFLVGLARQAKADRQKQGKVLNYMSLASDMFDDYVRQYNKKGGAEHQPAFQERGDFLHSVLLQAQQDAKHPVTAYDPQVLESAQKMLEKGVWGGWSPFGENTQGFRQGGTEWGVFGEKAGTMYNYLKENPSGSQTATGGNLDKFTQWRQDPASIPGDTPEDALMNLVKVATALKINLNNEQRQTLLTRIKAARASE